MVSYLFIMCITGRSSAFYISASITAMPASTSLGQEHCGNINLTLDGVTEDPPGLAIQNTFDTAGVYAEVALNFVVITRVEVIATVSRDNCEIAECCVKNATREGIGRPAPGYGSATSRSTGKKKVYVDMGCEAELQVCGKGKLVSDWKQTLSFPDKSHKDMLGRFLMIG